MKICLFDDNRLGVVEGEDIIDVSTVLEQIAPERYPFPRQDMLITQLPELLLDIEKIKPQARRIPLGEVTLHCPVANPGKIVAAPVNYQAHLDEAIEDTETFSRSHVRKIQETGLFLKATSSLIGPEEPIVISLPDRRTDHEIELVAVIGKKAKNVPSHEALSYVCGYSIGLDITIRGPEERSLRKSLDSYSVMGPWLVTADDIPDPGKLEIALDVNGEPRQRANTRDLILSVADLIEFASKFYTLEPGDLIFTGTPEGVGPIKSGDVINCRIERIGELNKKVIV